MKSDQTSFTCRPTFSIVFLHFQMLLKVKGAWQINFTMCEVNFSHDIAKSQKVEITPFWNLKQEDLEDQ